MAKVSIIIDVLGKLTGMKNLQRGFKNMRGQVQGVANQMKGAFKQMSANFLNTEKSAAAFANKLGFIAFQWTFIANVAKQALDSIIRGLQDVLRAGADAQNQIVRAMAFSLDGVNSVDKGAQNLQKTLELIKQFGRGQSPFNEKQIGQFVEQLNKATGSLEKTEKLLPFAIDFSILEPDIAPEKLAATLNSIVEATEVDTDNLEQLRSVMDAVANTANKSGLSFDSAAASFSTLVAGSKNLGLTLSETGAILALSADNLARFGRLQSGRGAERLLSILREIKQEGTGINKQFKRFGIEIFDEGKFVGLANLIENVNEALVRQTGKQFRDISDEQKASFLANLNFSQEAQRVFLALLEDGADKIRDKVEEIRERGSLTGLARTIEFNSAQIAIDKIKNSIDSLKTDLVVGLNPALQQIAKIVSEFVNLKSVQEFFTIFGTVLGETVVPIVTSAVSILKKFFDLVDGSKRIIEPAVKVFVAFIAALGGFFIIASIIALMAVLGALVEKLTAGVLLFGLSMKSIFLIALAVGAALFGIRLIASELNKGLEEANFGLIALGATMTVLSGAFIAARGSMSGTIAILGSMGSLFANLGTRIVVSASALPLIGNKIQSLLPQTQRITQGMVNMFGQAGGNASSGFLGKVKGLPKGFGNIISSLGKGGIILAAAAAAIAIGAIIVQELDKRVTNSAFFKGGFQNRMEATLFQVKLAVASSVRAIADFFFKLPEAFSKAMGAIFESAKQAFGSIAKAFEKLTLGDIQGAFEQLSKDFNDFFQGADPFTQLRETFDLDFLIEQEIRRTAQKINKGVGNVDMLADAIAELLGEPSTNLTTIDAIKILNEELEKSVRLSPEVVKEINELSSGIIKDKKLFTEVGQNIVNAGDQISTDQFAEVEKRVIDMEGNLQDNITQLNESLGIGLGERQITNEQLNEVEQELTQSQKILVDLQSQRDELIKQELEASALNNKSAKALAEQRIELDKRIKEEQKRISELTELEKSLQQSVMTNKISLDKLTILQNILFETLKQYTNSVLLSQHSLDALTNNFNVTSLSFSKLKAAARELQRLYDSVRITSTGKVKSTRFGTGEAPSEAGQRANISTAQSNIEAILQALSGNVSRIGIPGIREGKTIDEIIAEVSKRTNTPVTINVDVPINIENAANLSPDDIQKIINEAVIDALENKVINSQ